jgi:ribose transport system ATP-binding protein
MPRWRGVSAISRRNEVVRGWFCRWCCAQSHLAAAGPGVPAGPGATGGNQQKIVLAKWLAAQVRLLLLDHPTRGIDVGAKEDVYYLLRTLTAAGLALVLVADTLEEAIGLSDRLVCMRDAWDTGIFDAPRAGKPSLLSVIAHVV